MLEHGAWLAPSAFEVAFVSLAHDDEHISRAIEALDRALEGGR
jgi:glutamate-1-semialdehyde 2,1-aminomutase